MFHLRRFPYLHHPGWATLLPPVESRLVVAAGLFACLALLALWEIETIRAAPLEPLGALILGVILGATTAVGFVVCRRWRLYLASRA